MQTRFHYGRLMHKALRGLMAEVLSEVAENGLPGDHHFFITFDTTHPGVDMPAYLRERHSDEMTIVLQDWFENLTVAPDRFAVTLNFADTPEPLVVPFEAIKTFVDPSVEFGLRFDAKEDPDDVLDRGADGDAEDEDDAPHKDGEVVSLDEFRKH